MAFEFRTYPPHEAFEKPVAYFSMEFAIDQALKTYSGGLGFLAGSHMRSAYELKQNIIGIGILWTFGYYDQSRNEDQTLRVDYTHKHYSFLEDTGILFSVSIHDTPVMVRFLYLHPDTFGTAPMFFLTTDIPENDYISRTISHHLYDSDTAARIAQSILLGVGGGKLLDELNLKVDVYHLNEGHGLPLAFYLYQKFGNLGEVQKRLVFTTHTPELAGNEEHPIALLNKMTFFGGLAVDEVKTIAQIQGDHLNYTLTALRMAKIANGVSKVHGIVANEMWGKHEGICKIQSITNSQNGTYWRDHKLHKALRANDDDQALVERKKELKKELFKIVADQTGKLFDPNVLTVVWARRFAAYKRADLILRDWERFEELVTRAGQPVQMIWAGKPYPKDYGAIGLFNDIIRRTKHLKRCALLTGYELQLSGYLKKGSDIWLNTPRFPREASGTSGMTAAMNGSASLSIADGWIPEFVRHGENSFVIPIADPDQPEGVKDDVEAKNLLDVLEKEIVPMYYQTPEKFLQLIKTGMREVEPEFESGRMATEYYQQLYTFSPEKKAKV